MILKKSIQKEVHVPYKIICDVCKKEYYTSENGFDGSDPHVDDSLEVQEFVYIRHCGGFRSVFGDGSVMRIDMCQHCFKKLLGKYIKDETPYDEL